ncbi:MAG: uroporphyrinogen-III synthase [Acidimicrobiales bacterium]|nr:MAG: uroporphyrinogen-III synthase [Acidimicrobiales bacterium]
MRGPLAGCCVIVTREHPGELASLLEARGATVIHVPLIQVVEPLDSGEALTRELDRLGEFDWLVVTSPAGAERVGAAAADEPSVRLAVVGNATADVLAGAAGRPVDLVPATQRSQTLLEELCAVAAPAQRFLVAQADRAGDTLAAGLRRAGHEVTSVVAYRTVLCTPGPAAIAGADAVLFASGSAAKAWFDALGDTVPPIVVSIGPTTSTVAEELGLKVTSTAADHSLGGLVSELERILSIRAGDGSESAASRRPQGSVGVQQSGEINPTK